MSRAVSDSILQGQLIISEQNFTRLFPSLQGYRFFLIDDPSVRSAEQADRVAGVVERDLAPFGFDAVSTAERLAAFHRVENTYLSTFQALGGLGLLLGTIGLSAIMFRNVLERRRELALLGAVGYDARRISTMIAAEASVLVGAGVIAGSDMCCDCCRAGMVRSRGQWTGNWAAVLCLPRSSSPDCSHRSSPFVAALRGRMLAALRSE